MSALIERQKFNFYIICKFIRRAICKTDFIYQVRCIRIIADTIFNTNTNLCTTAYTYLLYSLCDINLWCK